MSERARLAVNVDGGPMPDEEARALWVEFSAYMDEHQGDFSGFAKSKGWSTVVTEYKNGQAVLVVRTTDAPIAKKRKRKRR